MLQVVSDSLFNRPLVSFAGLHPALLLCCANPCKTDREMSRALSEARSVAPWEVSERRVAIGCPFPCRWGSVAMLCTGRYCTCPGLCRNEEMKMHNTQLKYARIDDGDPFGVSLCCFKSIKMLFTHLFVHISIHF